MATYFGNQTLDNNESTDSAIWMKNKNYTTGFTCPGSGDQTVVALDAYVYGSAGTGHARIAVLDASNNVLCQGSAEFTVTTTAGWQGHTTFSGNTTLTGGTTYYLAITFDSTDCNIYYKSGSTGDSNYASVDYTGGFPASLTATNDYYNIMAIRCGVEAASGTALSIHQSECVGNESFFG